MKYTPGKLRRFSHCRQIQRSSRSHGADGLPAVAFPIMFVTNTSLKENQVRKNIHYVSGGIEQFSRLPPGSKVFPLGPLAPLRVTDGASLAAGK